MNSVETWHAETLGKKACEALSKNGFEARYVSTRAEALAYVESLVKPGMTVGFGGSMTIKELGAHASVERLGGKIIDHQNPNLSRDEKFATMRAELTSDLFLSSSNAITLDGELYNIDGNGNRVAAMTFGPKKIVIVAGYNKIVRNMSEAEARLQTIAAPMNCKRLSRPTPCVKSGTCMDCKGDDRICRIYTVHRRRPSWSDFSVVIVGEALGY